MMAPPDPSGQPVKGQADTGPAVPFRARGLPVLKKRAEFLAAARGLKQARAGFILQALSRNDDGCEIRVGFTCSKKVGNAVARNRAKRRLREIARAVLPTGGEPGWDYVLIGREGATAALPLPRLNADLTAALDAIHGRPRQ